jgi:hypothetical protein
MRQDVAHDRIVNDLQVAGYPHPARCLLAQTRAGLSLVRERRRKAPPILCLSLTRRALCNWSAQISGVRFLALLGMTLKKTARNGCHSERKRGIYRVQRAHQFAPLDGYAKFS